MSAISSESNIGIGGINSCTLNILCYYIIQQKTIIIMSMWPTSNTEIKINTNGS